LPALANYYKGPKLTLPPAHNDTAKHKTDSGNKKAVIGSGGRKNKNKYSAYAYQLERRDDEE
jgi:hypothetical protein